MNSNCFQNFEDGTFLENEEAAYPNGGQTRKGLAIFPDGILRRVWAGIPDTYFSIPAHSRYKGKYIAGWLSINDHLDSVHIGALVFHPNGNQNAK